MKLDISENNTNDAVDLKKELYRYIVFWPYFLIFLIICLLGNFIYLRYTENIYQTSSSILIIDDAMDSEMALPTAMTIFNRSTINLENEIEVIKSYRLLKKVIIELKQNISHYAIGRIRTPQMDPSEWFDGIDYNFTYKYDLDSISSISSYLIDVNGSGLKIINENNDREYIIEGYDTNIKSSDLPFTLIINQNQINQIIGKTYKVVIKPVNKTYEEIVKNLEVLKVGEFSDILKLNYKTKNRLNGEILLNKIISEFDSDGITDRQLVYKRTIDFVDSRFEMLSLELDTIELTIQDFKRNNELSFIESDATFSKNIKTSYDSELFKSETQLDLINLVLQTLSLEKFDYIPVNVGLEEDNLNKLIAEYNLLLLNRDKFISSAGNNNPYLISTENQLKKLSNNILNSINSYKSQLNLKISNLKSKEQEVGKAFADLPENERNLRSIQRQQKIKEALFLLLLQKREEASINFAVTKPSIKIIDYAITSVFPVSPNPRISFILSVFVGICLPLFILYLWFMIDTKIHTKQQIIKLFKNKIPVIGEIPYINNLKHEIINSDSRNPLIESFRMLVTNLNFMLIKSKDNVGQCLLVTSTIKGEGKTFVSINVANVLSSHKKNKVILIGADLRNPQIHKSIGFDKNQRGLSDYIFDKDKHYRDYIINPESVDYDIILSGTIPPNPTDLLASDKFSNLLAELKLKYDYIIVDSAPCLLVSDTFEISNLVDSTIYIMRANFSETSLSEFISECYQNNKLSNISLVLNSVGNSVSYGYKYGYQYGYQYGYRYAYNYGYGYGYNEDKEETT